MEENKNSDIANTNNDTKITEIDENEQVQRGENKLQTVEKNEDNEINQNNQNNNMSIPNKVIHIPPDLIKHLGNKFYLDLEKNYANSILLVTTPGCPICVSLHTIMVGLQIRLPKTIVYGLNVWDADPFSILLAREMDISSFPKFFHVDKKGKITGWYDKFPNFPKDNINVESFYQCLSSL